MQQVKAIKTGTLEIDAGVGGVGALLGKWGFPGDNAGNKTRQFYHILPIHTALSVPFHTPHQDFSLSLLIFKLQFYPFPISAMIKAETCSNYRELNLIKGMYQLGKLPNWDLAQILSTVLFYLFLQSVQQTYALRCLTLPSSVDTPFQSLLLQHLIVAIV